MHTREADLLERWHGNDGRVVAVTRAAVQGSGGVRPPGAGCGGLGHRHPPRLLDGTARDPDRLAGRPHQQPWRRPLRWRPDGAHLLRGPRGPARRPESSPGPPALDVAGRGGCRDTGGSPSALHEPRLHGPRLRRLRVGILLTRTRRRQQHRDRYVHSSALPVVRSGAQRHRAVWVPSRVPDRRRPSCRAGRPSSGAATGGEPGRSCCGSRHRRRSGRTSRTAPATSRPSRKPTACTS